MDRNSGHANKTKGEAGKPSPLESLLKLRRFNGPAEQNFACRLFGRDRHWDHRNNGAAIGLGAEFNTTFDFGEQCVVGAHADIHAGMPCGAALTGNDIARDHVLATKRFDSKAFTSRVTSVAR